MANLGAQNEQKELFLCDQSEDTPPPKSKIGTNKTSGADQLGVFL